MASPWTSISASNALGASGKAAPGFAGLAGMTSLNPWTSVLSGGMNAMGNMFYGNDMQDAYNNLSSSLGNTAQNYQQAQQQGDQYMMPFYTAGQSAIPQYQTSLNQMSNPSQYVNDQMNNYQTSPWAQYQMNDMTDATNAAAAAAGTLGSTGEQTGLAQSIQNIASQDQQSYLNNVLGVNNNYLSGLQGLMTSGQNAGNTMGQYGFDAAKGISQSQMLAAMAQFGAANSKANQSAGLFGSLGGMF